MAKIHATYVYHGVLIVYLRIAPDPTLGSIPYAEVVVKRRFMNMTGGTPDPHLEVYHTPHRKSNQIY